MSIVDASAYKERIQIIANINDYTLLNGIANNGLQKIFTYVVAGNLGL